MIKYFWSLMFGLIKNKALKSATQRCLINKLQYGSKLFELKAQFLIIEIRFVRITNVV